MNDLGPARSRRLAPAIAPSAVAESPAAICNRSRGGALSLILAAVLWFTPTDANAQSLMAPELDVDGPPGPKAAALFGSRWHASRQSASPVGSYALGCIAGAVELPESGPTWQAMRLSRNRAWGHRSTIEFIIDLSREAARLDGWAGLYVGDISQPRGGPMRTGHRSHQIGLDVDIWLFPPTRLDLSFEERETISAVSVRSEDSRRVNDFWRPTHMHLLKAAAEDPRVDRIFITAPAKIWMCEQTRGDEDRIWLQKIRPYWGHHYHFHVRLKCPEGSADCTPQKPGVGELSGGGDGCDESLTWWVTEALKPPDPDAPEPPKVRGPADYVMAELPAACQAVLDAPGIVAESVTPADGLLRPPARSSVTH